MMDFQFDDDIDLGANDEILIGDDDIRRCDIVRVERVDENKVLIRKAKEDDVASPSSRTYRVERGDGPDSIRFTRLR